MKKRKMTPEVEYVQLSFFDEIEEEEYTPSFYIEDIEEMLDDPFCTYYTKDANGVLCFVENGVATVAEEPSADPSESEQEMAQANSVVSTASEEGVLTTEEKEDEKAFESEEEYEEEMTMEEYIAGDCDYCLRQDCSFCSRKEEGTSSEEAVEDEYDNELCDFFSICSLADVRLCSRGNYSSFCNKYEHMLSPCCPNIPCGNCSYIHKCEQHKEAIQFLLNAIKRGDRE